MNYDCYVVGAIGNNPNIVRKIFNDKNYGVYCTKNKLTVILNIYKSLAYNNILCIYFSTMNTVNVTFFLTIR